MSDATSARTRILASAGTGKTFRLTSHFLALLLAGAEPDRILATTFTRKAAGEILERVLMRLAAAATDPAALRELADAVGLPALDAARCGEELRRMVWNLQRFQVRTLDSFFVRVATLFGLELGLPPGWSIADETEGEALRAEAVRRLLTDRPPDELIELLRGLHARPATRDVHDSLLKLLGAGRVALLDSRKDAWDRLPLEAAPDDAVFDAALGALAEETLPANRGGGPNKPWRRAVDEVLAKGHSRDWDGLLGNGLLGKLLDGEDRFAGRDISEGMRSALEPVRARLTYEHVARLARRNRSMQRLLEELDGHYLDLLRERGQLRFEDVPALLDPREGESPIAPDDMWFRLDAQLDHLLLDEFQDTSSTQWRVLEPLASEIVAEAESGRSFFCVGDVKQCIYYWRQAEPRLLKEMQRLLPGLDESEPLVTSYRSSPVVLDTVNRVFGELGPQPVFEEKATEGLLGAVTSFSESFQPHVAHHAGMPGGALLVEAPATPGEDPENPGPSDPLDVTARRICTVLARHPNASVGVLFRTNASIPRMMHLLGKRGLRASGEGGNLLTDSVAVLHFLSVLTLADHPEHTLAAFAVATSPLGPALGLEPTARPDATRLASVAAGIRTRILDEGYGAYCASFARTVDEAYGGWDARRFAQLVDLAEGWKEPPALRPGRFVAHVLATRVEDPAASNIQCMTIHAAKGLEFDAVFLPELHGDLVQAPRELLTHRNEPDGLLDAISIKPIEKVKSTSKELEDLYRLGKERALEEALSVLYVALTRARCWVEMIVPAPAKRQRKASPANLLRQVFGATESTGAEILWQHEDTDLDADWVCDARAGAEPAEPSSAPPATLGLAAAAGPRHPATRSPSSISLPGGERRRDGVAELLQRPNEQAMQHGTLVHRLAQEIEWLDDFSPTDPALDDLLAPLEADREARARAVAALRAGLAQPEVAELLSRPQAPGDAASREVVRERRFSTELEEPDGTTTLWNGAIDRLVLRREHGRPVAADVIDYKSDAIGAEEARERSDRYRPQMEAYRRVVVAQTKLPESAVRMLLVYLGPGCVTELR